eukprot:jgi/Bigna1/69837/fgenesh1_pg.10_\
MSFTDKSSWELAADSFLKDPLADSEFVRLNKDLKKCMALGIESEKRKRNVWVSKKMRVCIDRDETLKQESVVSKDKTTIAVAEETPICIDVMVQHSSQGQVFKVTPVQTFNNKPALAPSPNNVLSSDECSDEETALVAVDSSKAMRDSLKSLLLSLEQKLIDLRPDATRTRGQNAKTNETRLRAHTDSWKTAIKKYCQEMVEGKTSMRAKPWWFVFYDVSSNATCKWIKGWKGIVSKFAEVKPLDMLFLELSPSTVHFGGLGRCAQFYNQIPELLYTEKIKDASDWQTSAYLLSPKALTFAIQLTNRIENDTECKIFPKTTRNLEYVLRLVESRFTETAYTSSPPLAVTAKHDDQEFSESVHDRTAQTLSAAPDAATFYGAFYDYETIC